MLGWEFPPYISGGLGTACQGLTDALKRRDARVLFILPRAADTFAHGGSQSVSEAKATEPTEELQVAPIPCDLNNPYYSANERSQRVVTSKARFKKAHRKTARKRAKPSSVRVMGVGSEDGYDGDLVRKIRVFTDRCLRVTRREIFDVIHAHDWMTFPAAEGIARFSGRPLIVHVHATEFDRSGDTINVAIYDMERRGMHAADRVIAVSNRTRNTIIERYGVPPEKVMVIHNGVAFDGAAVADDRSVNGHRTVLFLGRITMQKGPEFFVRAAARVARHVDDVRFVMAGSGDLLPRMVELARELGIDDRMEFTGFLRGADVGRAYRRADVFVMPSVSEPFGLTALEAVHRGVPVVLSKTSGAAEVLRYGALKVDFWDTEMMAKMIVAILHNPSLAEMLRHHGGQEIRRITWDQAAGTCVQLYNELASESPGRSDAAAVHELRRETAPEVYATM
jgi:glycogen(starch) synthase